MSGAGIINNLYFQQKKESWKLRGIIPRTILHVYDEIERRSNCEFSVYVSFLEIYNENAYDLLDKKHID